MVYTYPVRDFICDKCKSNNGQVEIARSDTAYITCKDCGVRKKTTKDKARRIAGTSTDCARIVECSCGVVLSRHTHGAPYNQLPIHVEKDGCSKCMEIADKLLIDSIPECTDPKCRMPKGLKHIHEKLKKPVKQSFHYNPFNDWLIGGPLTIEQVERENTSEEDGRVPHVPFGFVNSIWEEFKSKIRRGDKLRAYCSPQETWDCLAGRAGVAIVRDGEVVEIINTLVN
jgi:hypothetical protein